jgi:serine-type D-Ala-D-Ala endopeptidase (penicillin-binding protein 7)
MRVILAALLLAVSGLCSAHTNIVYDVTDNMVIAEQGMDTPRAMASLTKLMTALLIVESDLDLEQKVSYRGSIWFSKQVSRLELLDSLLIRSDNHAANALADSWPGGRRVFVETMNTRARELGMFQTTYADPSGLDNRNVSTASDITNLIVAVGQYRLLSNISTTKYLMVERKYKKKIKQVLVGNTNRNLLFDFDEIILSKTGTTSAAGRCLALLVEKNDKQYAIVILGEKDLKAREQRARNLIFNYVIINE